MFYPFFKTTPNNKNHISRRGTIIINDESHTQTFMKYLFLLHFYELYHLISFEMMPSFCLVEKTTFFIFDTEMAEENVVKT